MPSELAIALVPLVGSTRTRLLVTRAAPVLLASWDGGTERVAYLRVPDRGMSTIISGFWSRERAIHALTCGAPPDSLVDDRALGTWALKLAALVRGSLSIQCLILDRDQAEVVEIRPEDLRRATERDRRARFDELVELLGECATRPSAVRCVRGALEPVFRLVAAQGHRSRLCALELLESFLAHRWDETAVVLFAIARARIGLRTLPATPACLRAGVVLDALREAVLMRLDVAPTSLGGFA